MEKPVRLNQLAWNVRLNMADTAELLKNRKININKLFSFGFTENNNGYSYSTYLLDGKFEMIVSVTKDGQQVTSEIFDCSTKERYVLHRISNATGSFVSRVRKEYGRVLDSIANSCCEPHIFKSKDAEQVICYVREKYHDELQFLWKKFPQNAVFRRQDNSKWYVALLILSKKKLGLLANDMVDIIDLRVNPQEVDSLVDGEKYFPGYHMNKKHWVTICLDGSVPLEEVFCRIDERYVLASEKKLTKGTKNISFSKTQIGKDCLMLELLACRLGRNDEAPNVELAQKLCDNTDKKEIQEIVSGLKSDDQAVANDCIKVLYAIGQRKPELIADFADDFITLLSGKNNRVAWGSMMALACIAPIKSEVIFNRLPEIITAYKKGSVITVDNSISVFAQLCKANNNYQTKIFPILLEHLANCRAKEIPQHAERMAVCINAGNKEAFIVALEARTSELSESQSSRILKLKKKFITQVIGKTV